MLKAKDFNCKDLCQNKYKYKVYVIYFNIKDKYKGKDKHKDRGYIVQQAQQIKTKIPVSSAKQSKDFESGNNFSKRVLTNEKTMNI